MLGNVTASQCLLVRLSQLQDAGVMEDEHASLAKAFCTVRMRETVGWARELLGGNGILLEESVGRFVDGEHAGVLGKRGPHRRERVHALRPRAREQHDRLL
jgi:alkylation response protein AidB-like acyl-CoA dehydrogenase